MKTSHLILLLFLSSCAPAPTSFSKKGAEQLTPATGAVMGKSKPEEVKKTLGDATSQTSSTKTKGVDFIEYANRPDHLKFQVTRGVIDAEFRSPALGSPQSTLQYWRHRWKGIPTRFEKVETGIKGHEEKLMQFSAPGLGAAVIYDPSADRVTRVVRYAD